MSTIIDHNNWIIQHDDNGNCFKVNTATGEAREGHLRMVYDGDTILSPEAKEEHKKYLEQEKQKKMRRTVAKKLGDYYFVNSNQDFADLTPASVARLIYLSTFTDYINRNGKLRLNSKTDMHKDDLAKVLCVCKTTADTFWSEVSPKYISEDADGLMFTNQSIFVKGALPKGPSYYRMYVRWIRQLYKATPKNKHKHLGYIFQLLPFINIDFNIICHNPHETDLDLVEPITLDELCQKIGYETSNRHRLLKIYNEIQFDVDGRKERFLSIVSNGLARDNGKARMFVNPHILYSGSKFENVKILGKF